jgi:glycosyltransferase involved in cell wall biosynthesis
MNEDKLLKEPLISVVTPVYNTETYLAECIESVLLQSYANYEYIIVNNCSTDRSLDIAQSYAKKDRRIRVVDYDLFVGQSQNYNRALQLISDKSKYCKIVQADDWIFPECLSKMAALAETKPSIGIVSSYRILGTMISNYGLPFPISIISGRETCRRHLIDGIYLFGSQTSLLFGSDIVRKRTPFFPERSYHPDAEACYEILQDRDFGFVHEILTFSRTDNDSISSDRLQFNPNLLSAFVSVLKYGNVYLEKDEYARCYGRVKERYFKFLGRAYLRNCDGNFWAYHRQGLENIGYSLRKRELVKYALLFILDKACDPYTTVSRTVERFKMARHNRRQNRKEIRA